MTNAGVTISRVLPSGAARATASVPIAVLAPGRFSTITVTPCARPMCSAIRRARTSLPPPGGAATTTLIGFVACGHARSPNSPSVAKQATITFLSIVMIVPGTNSNIPAQRMR
jgi:hypothetical protein